MKIGAVIGMFGMTNPVDGILTAAARIEADGLDSAWITQGGIDALSVLAMAGKVTTRIELGVAVVPIQLRHPLAMASGANTAALATGGRFTLGIGLSHKPYVEGTLGVPFERPVAQLERYLDALIPALDERVPLVLAALGPRMLRLCGERSAGTVTWLTGRRTVRDHIAPTLRAIAPGARIAVALPICVTADVEGARNKADERLAYTAQMPSYRAMMAREGVETPADLALIGDEATVQTGLDELAAAGATDFLAIELVFAGEDGARTRDLLRRQRAVD